MPTPAYMSITGATQGNISENAFTSDSVGNTYQEGHENECLVQALMTNVTVPTDPQSGQPTGIRSHRPTSFTKVFDKASPLLWQALATGEVLQMEVNFYRVSTAGIQEKYYTIKFEDAVLVDGKGYMPNCLDPDNHNFVHMEDWAFVYRKVTWSHGKANTEGSDDWRKPVQG